MGSDSSDVTNSAGTKSSIAESSAASTTSEKFHLILHDQMQ